MPDVQSCQAHEEMTQWDSVSNVNEELLNFVSAANQSGQFQRHVSQEETHRNRNRWRFARPDDDHFSRPSVEVVQALMTMQFQEPVGSQANIPPTMLQSRAKLFASGSPESLNSNVPYTMAPFSVPGGSFGPFQSNASTPDVATTTNPSVPAPLTDAEFNQLFNELFGPPSPIAQAGGNMEVPLMDSSYLTAMPDALLDALNTAASSQEAFNEPDMQEESNEEWEMRWFGGFDSSTSM